MVLVSTFVAFGSWQINDALAASVSVNNLFEDLPVSLTDSDGDTTSDVLSVRVLDDVPSAISDVDEVGTGASTSGNVFAGTDDDALDAVQPDVPGADRTDEPALLGDRDELQGADESALGVPPAHQRLHADDRA